MSEQGSTGEEVDLSVRACSKQGVVTGEREESDAGEGHVHGAAVLRAAGAGLAFGPRLLTGLDEVLGPDGHKPWRRRNPRSGGEMDAGMRSYEP